MPTKIKLSDFKERKELEGAIDIETEDGQVFRLPPPELWPDETQTAAMAGDLVAIGRLVLGEDAYERFVAAGGSAGLLNAIFKDVHGLGAPES